MVEDSLHDEVCEDRDYWKNRAEQLEQALGRLTILARKLMTQNEDVTATAKSAIKAAQEANAAHQRTLRLLG